MGKAVAAQPDDLIGIPKTHTKAEARHMPAIPGLLSDNDRQKNSQKLLSSEAGVCCSN